MGDHLNDYAVLSQSFDGGSAGQVYFLSVDVELPSLSACSQGTCIIKFSIENQDLLVYDYGMSAQQGSVTASGILVGKPSHLDLQVTWYDYNGNEFITHASFANVQLSVYNPSAGTNPMRPVATEGLTNNNFDSGILSPWTTYTTSATEGRMTFEALDGKAVVTYGGIDANSPTPARIDQQLDKPAEVGQNIRVRAEVHIETPTAGTGTTCTVELFSGEPKAWTVENVGSSQTYHVDVWQTLTARSVQFSLFSSCTGTLETTKVSFDNVYYTVNSPPSTELVNGDFGSGNLSSWTTRGGASMDFGVIDGKAVITYSRSTTSTSAPAYIEQSINTQLQVGQKIRVQADVLITIPNAGATGCAASINIEDLLAWSVKGVTDSSSNYRVDVELTLTSASQIFSLYSSCRGSNKTTSVSFDNVVLTLLTW
jgi:hypothetical protein